MRPLQKLRRDLAAKAALLLAGMYVVGALAGSTKAVVDDYANRRDLLLERGVTLAEYAASAVAEPLASGGTESVERILTKLRERPDIEIAYVLDRRRVVIGSAEDAPKFATPGAERDARKLDILALGAAATRSDIDKTGARVAAPVFHQGRVMGVVHIAVPREAAGATAEEIILRDGLIVLMLLAFAVPLGWFGARRALRPVDALVNAAKSVQDTNRFDVRVDVRTGDQLETLGDAFNAMLERLGQSHARMETLAYVDAVTGLPNKERLRAIVGEVNREASGGAFLLIDLDRFKRINETLGRGEGDRVLKTVADRVGAATKRLTAELVGRDAQGFDPPSVGRIGGAEFVVVAPGFTGREMAERLARCVAKEIAAPIEVDGHRLTVTASVGVARFPDNGAAYPELLTCAEQACAEVKRAGGSGARMFENELSARALERMRLEAALREGIAKDEIEAFFQPKVDARTGRIAGCEALARWRRPGLGIVGPGVFISVAEETGLIGEIGARVLARACQAAARWRAMGVDCPVAVNVSALEFMQHDFGERVLAALAAADLPPQFLELELTESVIMAEPERAVRQIAPLREIGLRFAIDDFGTGHSSLAYLTRLPFDVFKIDQAFVRVLDTDASARVVIETILAMARALGYDTVAEGVETPSHLAFLQLSGCKYLQGYLFGRPQSEADFTELLSARQELMPDAIASVGRA